MAKDKPGRRPGQDNNLDPQDAALWAEMMEDVTPLPGRDRPSVPEIATPTPEKRAKAPRQPTPIPEPVHVPTALIGSGLDARTRERLQRGQMTIEATIDLHGHTRDEARQALTAFLLSAYHAGRRCVLVITGKGRLTKNDEKPWWDSNRGVLKAGFNDWVREAPLDRVVLHTAPAKGQHGGGGAFYVLLRRERAL